MSKADQTQQGTIDFLLGLDGPGGETVTRIDTHVATVFLAGPRALKIKRAVRFPYLDFSTLPKRKAACEAEIEVNRRLAPQIYRGVVAITREAGGGLALDGQGTPVEWAVEMRRFDERQTLDHLAEAGKIDGKLAGALGHAVALAHDKAPVVKCANFAAALLAIVEQNDAELRATPDLFAAGEVTALTKAARAALTRLNALLASRESAGLVRQCHGDLHLGNIVRIDGAPVLFDAIEFDPTMATGDVLYDIAFLLMDLIERKLTAVATMVLNRYLTETRRADDLDALAALPLYLSVRAAIRAKVTASRGGAAQSAKEYFALALSLLTPPQPKLVAIGGLSGTGKSVLAGALAAELPPAPGAIWLRSDVERKAMFGVAETEPLPEAAYSAAATAAVYAILSDKARRVLAAGHSAIVDAVFAEPRERDMIAQAAGGAAFKGLFLTADLATRLTRVGGRKGDASDAGAAVARRQEQYNLGALDWNKIDASGEPGATLRRARAALG